VAPGWLDSCVLERYLSGVANDVFNGMEAVMCMRGAAPDCRAARHCSYLS
jgi:hypothetical protein